MNSEKATMIVALALAFLALGLHIVVAEPGAPQSVSVQGSSSRDLSQLGAQTVDARGGNVTEININALAITTSWQGYYGDISGEITLDDGSANTFYNWTLTAADGEVYATRNDTVTWSEVVCANTTHFGQEETYLGQSATDGDSVSNTYNAQSHPAFAIGTRTINADSCNTTNAYVNNNTQSTNWTQVLLHQNDTNSANVVYMTIINDSTVGFDGQQHDFQLLVGENEKSGSIGTTTYYFWVELN